MIKAVIFDFDDTLVETYEVVSENLKLVLKKNGLNIPTERDLREHWGKSCNELFSTLWPGIDKNIIYEQEKELLKTFKSPSPVKGVHEMLDLLSNKFILGIVTGGDKNFFMEKIIKAGIDIKKFSFVLTQDEVQKPKSDPGYFAPAFSELEKLGISKNEVLFVGDSVYDYEAAKNAGILFAGVLTGPASREDFMKKGVKESMIIPSVMELPGFIKSNGF